MASYEEALTLFRQVGDKLGEANIYYSRGKLLILTGESKGGLEELQSALNIYEQIDAISSQSNIYFFLGQVLASDNHKEEVAKMVREAVRLGEQIDPMHPVTLYMKEYLQKLLANQNRAGESSTKDEG